MELFDCNEHKDGKHEKTDEIEVNYAQVLESIYLDEHLRDFQEMFASMGESGTITDSPYILDIDLDYLHAERAIHPKDPKTWYRLIRGAAGITIAREPWFVADLKLNGEAITSDILQDAMMRHIENALQ